MKEEYLKKLKKLLKKNKIEKADEIVDDINELFDAKMAEGKSEQAIVVELGEPKDVVKQYLGDTPVVAKKKMPKIFIVFICICSIWFVSFATVTILAGVGVIDAQKSNNIVSCVYLESSKTNFEDDEITITLKNVSDKDFEDKVVRLMYLGADGKPVGAAYSEQKIVTINANSEKEIVFANPGWEYSTYNEICASVQLEEHEPSPWVQLKVGRTFVDINAGISELRMRLIVFGSILSAATLVADIVLVFVAIKKKNEK